MTSEFRPHDLVWTRENSNRIWEYISANPAWGEAYFSRQVGDDLIAQVRRRVPLRGSVLDFGCGQGFLLEKMVAAGIACQGVDFSAKSVELTNGRLKGNPLFKGALVLESLPAPLPDRSFDAIFFIETIEHVIGEDLPALIRELHRLLRPGGHLVVTTRNDESLEASKILCPECGCTFHQMQHVSSWSAASLASTLAGYGFQRVFCEGLVFAPRVKFGALGRWLYRKAYRTFKRSVPNLLYIGTATSSS